MISHTDALIRHPYYSQWWVQQLTVFDHSSNFFLVAWRVDFNSALLSFETNIRSVRNLVDFSLSSSLQDPPRLLFISSVAVFNRNNSFSYILPMLHY